MPGEPSPDKCDQVVKRAYEEVVRFLDAEGVTLGRLARKLNEKLDARVTQTVKLRGQVEMRSRGRPKNGTLKPDRLPPTIAEEVRVLAQGSKLEVDKDKKTLYDDGDTVIAWEEVAHDVQLKALEMAYQLHGAFPPEEKRLAGPGGGPISLTALRVEFVRPNGNGQQTKREGRET